MESTNNLYNLFNTDDKSEYEHFAALDIGSNSFHLVIARSNEGQLQIVNKIKHKVRLAEGLDENHVLNEEYIEKGLQTLATMAAALEGLPKQKVRCVATYTLRKAVNANAFIRRARAVFPYPINVVAGAEEARLIYVGVTSNLRHQHPHLIFDIGGGSTEFAIGEQLSPWICKSINMGCVSFQKRFFPNGDISQRACDRAIQFAKQELELATISLKRYQWDVVYASSGTAKAIASVIHGTESGEPTKAVSRMDLQLLLTRCLGYTHHDQLDFPGLSEERKPVFIAGLCVMLAVVQSLNIDSLEYVSPALREGVLYELESSNSTQNVCLKTTQSMAKRYSVDTDYAHSVLSTCMGLFNAIKHTWELDHSENRFTLGWACLLHEVGLQINSKGIQKHSAYIIQQSDMPGFYQEQQQLIAALVRNHRKKLNVKLFESLLSYSTEKCLKLTLLLRLAILLNINRKEAVIPVNFYETQDNKVTLQISKSIADKHALLASDIEAENQFFEGTGISVHLEIVDDNLK